MIGGVTGLQSRAAALAVVLVSLSIPSSGLAGPVALIVNPQNRTGKLSRTQVRAIFLCQRKTWSSGKQILAFSAPPWSTLRREFDRLALGLSRRAAADYWIDFRIRGHGLPLRSVTPPRLAVKIVERLPNAIAYVPLNAVTKGVRVLQVFGQPRRPASSSRPGRKTR